MVSGGKGGRRREKNALREVAVCHDGTLLLPATSRYGVEGVNGVWRRGATATEAVRDEARILATGCVKQTTRFVVDNSIGRRCGGRADDCTKRVVSKGGYERRCQRTKEVRQVVERKTASRAVAADVLEEGDGGLSHLTDESASRFLGDVAVKVDVGKLVLAEGEVGREHTSDLVIQEGLGDGAVRDKGSEEIAEEAGPAGRGGSTSILGGKGKEAYDSV